MLSDNDALHTAQVIAAEMTPSRRDVLLVCLVPGQVDDPHSFSAFSISVG